MNHLIEIISSNIIPVIDSNIIPIAGALILAAIGFYLTGLSSRKDRAAKACIDFQNLVRTELKGIYPAIELHLSADTINNQILQSIPNIQLAVSNFRSFVPFFRKRRFDIVAHKYYEAARKTDWNEQLAHQRYPNMAKPGYISPKEKLNKAVNKLLKFAK